MKKISTVVPVLAVALIALISMKGGSLMLVEAETECNSCFQLRNCTDDNVCHDRFCNHFGELAVGKCIDKKTCACTYPPPCQTPDCDY